MDCAFGLKVDLVNLSTACKVVGTATKVFRESCGGLWKNFVVLDLRIIPFGGFLTFIIAPSGVSTSSSAF